MSKEHNTVTCSHGKGLACPVCYDQSHSWEDSEFVVDPFDTYEEGELPSKSSCIALRASELNIEVIDQPAVLELEPGDLKGIPTPVGTIAFGNLPDGAYFYLAQTYAYGSRRLFQKVMEDGEHNAVWDEAPHIGELIPDGVFVIPKPVDDSPEESMDSFEYGCMQIAASTPIEGHNG